ncbi:DUF3177 family protein [Pseudanabaena sp. FACHB-2040]|uniref:DUF3177 family protein n=1 Tax=Pseudanabaena sp. FACHB-2040 TaxID=2692859 RepID=UPI0016853EB0|nr:DUF3177 family protein [Pseudanabaena sp. FACHB-2040]MBD2257629.1 DUF3177 family protein [Pseudanabaena sp. FACHB-2040]
MLDPLILRSLVWTDYRLAVLFLVSFPLVLLIWAAYKRNTAIQHLLTIYWKVSSLLMITIYLMIGGFSISFVSAVMARILIPVGLWFWVDLNEEIREQPDSALKLTFNSWRWAVTLYGIIGTAISLTYLPCAFSNARLASASCQAWLEAPLLYKEFLHANYTNGFLGFFGIVGLIIYMLTLAWFVFVRLGKQGRQAIN